jgi:glycine/D-amino acid oxidase-like deaminating enzyme
MSAAYSRNDYDVAVIGGGLLGSSIAWGLGRIGQRTTVLDEGDITKRASRANFALVWVQSKGLGMPEYTGWTVRASDAWARLASEIGDQTGIDVHHQRPGGFHLALSDHEMEQRQNSIRRLHNQPGATDYSVEFLDHDEVKKRLPHIGPDVVGGTYCPLDGHVNSLKYFRAIHTGLAAFGVDYRPEQPVSAIRHEGGEFRIDTPQGEIRAGKIVLAAGNANMALAPMVGLYAPMGPTRGQVLVTERTVPFLDFPLTTIRQTDEGTVMIGDSREEELDDRGHRLSIDAVMADRARRTFPILERLNIVRMWSGIRVMPQDGFPIYDQSETCPGAFVACCHSGVTLAPNHAFDIAPMVAAGALDEERLGAFSAKRFADKPKQASGYY